MFSTPTVNQGNLAPANPPANPDRTSWKRRNDPACISLSTWTVTLLNMSQLLDAGSVMKGKWVPSLQKVTSASPGFKPALTNQNLIFALPGARHTRG